MTIFKKKEQLPMEAKFNALEKEYRATITVKSTFETTTSATDEEEAKTKVTKDFEEGLLRPTNIMIDNIELQTGSNPEPDIRQIIKEEIQKAMQEQKQRL